MVTYLDHLSIILGDQTLGLSGGAGRVGRGLIETWSLSPDDAAHYLATRVGNHGAIDRDLLADQLRTPPDR